MTARRWFRGDNLSDAQVIGRSLLVAVVTALRWGIRLAVVVWLLPSILVSWLHLAWLWCRIVYHRARLARLRRQGQRAA